jgi:hypothetical protein
VRVNAEGGRREATVIGRWGDDTALLRTKDGATVEVPVPERLRDRVDVGANVDLLDDGVVNWRVPDDPARDPTP